MKEKDRLTLAEVTLNRINEYRFANNLTLPQFAKKANIPRTTLRNLENAHTKSPTLALIFKIAKAMEITPAELIDCEAFRDDRIEIE